MDAWLFLLFLIHHADSISIGRMSDASLILASSSVTTMMNGTEEKCLCEMIASSNISGFNYFPNDTCKFFSNASLTNAYFSWKINIGSTFYFLQFPTSPDSSACSIVSSPLVGSTVFGAGTPGSLLSQLSWPWSVTVNAGNSLLITDTGNGRVLQVPENASVGVVVASGGPWLHSRKAYFDDSRMILFVIDSDPCRMRRYYNSSSVFTVVFGGTCGTNSSQFKDAASFCMDSVGNFYVADNQNHRILFWGANTTNGILLAGITGVPGNDASHLYHPQDITFDEDNRFIYVADTFNHRILRYSFGNPNGTIVAGGNGPGVAPNQLNGPCGFYLSQSTGILYIADTSNNRIVRWPIGASQGITITGDCNGTAGNTALRLNVPTTITMDEDERYLYVSDFSNHRIQRFLLD